MNRIVLSVLSVYLAILMIFDMKTHRIPNWLSGLTAVIILILQGFQSGMLGVLDAFLGSLLGLLIFLPFYLLKAFAAGDVKAMAVIGMFLGPNDVLIASSFTLIAGAVIGLYYLWRFSGSVQRASRRLLGLMISPVLISGYKIPAVTAEVSSSASGYHMQDRFPYGVSIAIGTLLTLWSSGAMPYYY